MCSVILSYVKDQIQSTQVLAVTEAPTLVIKALLTHSWKIADSTKFCCSVFKSEQLYCDKFRGTFRETTLCSF